MKQSEKEALQEKIDELQARLDEQVEEASSRELEDGDVYDAGDGCVLMAVSNVMSSSLGTSLNVCLSPRDEAWLGTLGTLGDINHKGLDKEFDFLGTFDEVFVRRDKIREELKGKLLKMEGGWGETGEYCIENPTSFHIPSGLVGSFIDNLFDGKHCDGVPVE